VYPAEASPIDVSPVDASSETHSADASLGTPLGASLGTPLGASLGALPADAGSEIYSAEASPRPFEIKRSRFRFGSVLGIVLLVAALIIAGFLVYRYVNANQHNAEMDAAADRGERVAGDTVPPDAGIDDLVVNWDALKTINPDIAGWIMIPGTRINYPVVQASDNDFYLHHLSDKTPSDTGAIFLDSDNDPAITGWNNIIYGHNLLDGSMFASLKSYSEQGFFDEHRTVLLATPERGYRLEVVAALVCEADDKIRQFGFTDRVAYDAYVRMLLDYAVLSRLADDEIPQNLYCFATCTDSDYSKRTVVLASVAETRELEGA
jgi:sortase B